MNQIATPLIFRAAYLHLFIDLFREMGVPVDRALAQSRLPETIAENPDAYASLPLGLNWMARTGRDVAPMELGLLAARRLTVASLDRRVRNRLLGAVSGFERIERTFVLASIEDSAVLAEMRREGSALRLILDMSRIMKHPHACIVEGVSIRATIELVRGVIGPKWMPSEVTFISTTSAQNTIREEFDGAEVRFGQPISSVLVDMAALARSPIAPPGPELGEGPSPLLSQEETEHWTFVTALRSAILPYVAEHGAGISRAAEIAGVSQRTLQRRLNYCGTNFSEVLQQARFEAAREMLSDSAVNVGDVALMSGYENPQHFSRAFRKITGLTPSEYRSMRTFAGAA